MLRQWFRKWFLIDALALGLGVASTFLYICFADQLSEQFSTSKDVWSNLGTEILGVWISVRIIDALISSREERTRIRNTVIDTLTYMMQLCQDLPPYFDDWRRHDINNQLTWFEKKWLTRPGSKRFDRHFATEERAIVERVLRSVRDVSNDAERVALLRSAFERIADTGLRWHGPQDVIDLVKTTRHYAHGDLHDREEVQQCLATVREKLSQDHYDSYTPQIAELCHTTASLLEQMKEARTSIAALERTFSDLRQHISDD